MHRDRFIFSIGVCTIISLCILVGANHGASCSSNISEISLNDNSGRVEICLEGKKVGLPDFSIRTREANTICKQLGFQNEGAKILDGVVADGLDMVNCSWNELVFNCSEEYGASCSNKTAAIECRKWMFDHVTIALMVSVPLLSSLILVGIIIIIHFVRKVKRLNVIIHQLINKQQRIKSVLYQNNIFEEEGSIRSSMYARPTRAGMIVNKDGDNSSKEEEEAAEPNNGTPGTGQYSLIGEDKYVNIDLKVLEAPQEL